MPCVQQMLTLPSSIPLPACNNQNFYGWRGNDMTSREADRVAYFAQYPSGNYTYLCATSSLYFDSFLQVCALCVSCCWTRCTAVHEWWSDCACCGQPCTLLHGIQLCITFTAFRRLRTTLGWASSCWATPLHSTPA